MANTYIPDQYVQGSCKIPCISCKKVDYTEFIYGNETNTLCVACIYKLTETGNTNPALVPAITNIIIGKYKRDYDVDYIKHIMKIAIPYFNHIKIMLPVIVAGIKDDTKNVLTYIINIYVDYLLLAFWGGKRINETYLYFIEYAEALTKFALLPCTANVCADLLKSVLVTMKENKKVVRQEQFDHVKKYSELYYKMTANMLIVGMQAGKS